MKKILLASLITAACSSSSFAEEIYKNVELTKDVKIKTTSGYNLSANLYKPTEDGDYPVIVTMTPYDKDEIDDFNPEDGVIDASKHTVFEALDPKFWVPQGYALLVVDSAGMAKSEGEFSLLSNQEAKDYYDVIEWAGTQDWSNGSVGTAGVSYLAMNQWKVAEMNPPHLKAIMPWHGMSNLYKDLIYSGGVEETQFFYYWNKKLKSIANTPIESLHAYQQANPIYNERYASMAADMSKITVPAYIGAAWSDSGLHLTGTIKAFERLGSEKKWLEITGRKKWEQYYTWGAQNRMLDFADHFLKGENNDWQETPAVRYETMESYYLGGVQQAASFPLPETSYNKLYLNGKALTDKPAKKAVETTFSPSEQVRYNYTFTQDTEVTGHIKAELYVATTKGKDVDIFIEVEKLDSKGNKVNLPIFGSDDGGFTFGQLRASQRELDEKLSTDYQPEYTMNNPQYLTPNKTVKVEVALSPSSVSFKKGDILSLVISGKDINSKKAIHVNSANEGDIKLSMGDDFTSYLQIPVVPSANHDDD